MVVARGRLALFLLALAWIPAGGAAQPRPASTLEGMWSDAPTTIIARFCATWCTDAGVERLNALLDDPANDNRPLAQLTADASAYQLETSIRRRMTPAALASYPLDPADDPGLLECEPWGLARQMLAPHQIEIRRRGSDRIELHYGEWDARRTVYMDGRRRPAGRPPSRLGYSVGHWEGDVLVVETTGVAANQTMWRAKHSEQLRVVERFSRSTDGAMLNLTATLEDAWSLREPVVLKRNWRWAPTSVIAPYEDCKPPISVKRGVAQ
jgi:hypothetical protein